MSDTVAILTPGPTDNLLLVAFDRKRSCFVDKDGDAELCEFAHVIATDIDNNEKRTRRRARPYILGPRHTGDVSTNNCDWYEITQIERSNHS